MADPPSQPPASSQRTANTTTPAPVSDPPVSSIETEKDAAEPKPAGAGAPVATPKASGAPDPDEDDLDDLDDVLDDFAATRIDPSAAPSASGPGRPPAAAAAAATAPSSAAPAATSTKAGLAAASDDIPLGSDEFAQELQKGMADLLGELESSPEMQKQFEDMIRELSKGAGTVGNDDLAAGLAGGAPATAAAAAGASSSASGSAEAGAGTDASFQDTIRRTMERMKESGDAAGAAAATSATSEDDFMAALLKEMENGGSEEDFSKMLLGMMEQLTNKEILYEPMKELDTKYPDWMDKNASKTPEADLKRYKEQQRLVREIVEQFEQPGYSDENPKAREYILERMQKMQAEGTPPQELVGDMDVATQALGDLDAGCPTQ